jgi:hypothetical protein
VTLLRSPRAGARGALVGSAHATSHGNRVTGDSLGITTMDFHTLLFGYVASGIYIPANASAELRVD